MRWFRRRAQQADEQQVVLSPGQMEQIAWRVAEILQMPGEVRLTKAELAVRWNVSERSIERWMRDRGLPHEKVPGGSVRFAPSEVDRWWASLNVTAA